MKYNTQITVSAVYINFTPLKNVKELVMHTKLEISQYI